MKKIFLYTILLLTIISITTSCEKDKIGGTETEKMAGEWYVTVIAVDSVGNTVFTDDELFGLGHFHLDTYSEASNGTKMMWINDNGNFWNFKTKVNIDLNQMTFQADTAQNVSYDCKVTIADGKILYGAATTPSGIAADSIVFNVNFNDDPYPSAYAFASYRVAGFRYTGFTKDE